MHGEKWFDIRDSFASFSEYYVRDEFYVNLMTSLRCEARQFIVSMPSSMGKPLPKISADKTDFKIYLQNETETTLGKIRETVSSLQGMGYKVVLRIHPRGLNNELVTKFFTDEIIEKPDAVDMETSLATTNCVIGRTTTVMFQAYLHDIPVVIDDISNPLEYEMSKELDYIMCNKPHRLLSEILNQ